MISLSTGVSGEPGPADLSAPLLLHQRSVSPLSIERTSIERTQCVWLPAFPRS